MSGGRSLRLLAPHIRQSDLKLEVAHCVRGVQSPLLANIALSLLDEHFAEAWESWGDFNARSRRRRKGMATYRLVRYADDFVVLVAGTEHTPRHCETKWQRCFARWACACRRTRRRSPTSTRVSISWASASSGDARRDRTSGSSTPGRRRRRLPPSRPRCGRSPEEA